MSIPQFVLTETLDRVALITLNRPEKYNALCDPLFDQLNETLDRFEADRNIGCIVITGSKKAFAAGADIADIANYGFTDAYYQDYITHKWERVKACRKPVIAAVAGYALGGGCELALMCDMIYAADNAKFGLPEVTLGVIPGAGGTQRLPRAIGKAKAMDMCLTARFIDAAEAERTGLVARAIPAEQLMTVVLEIAQKIASYSLPTTMMIKECINRAYESSLQDGLMFERRVFHSAFALEDQNEGMNAFLEKRSPTFKHR